MYLDVSDVYPKMYLGLVWDTCKIHAKCQDTCILLECNRACKIHLRYIKIHSGYVYPSGYMQDTCRIHHDTSGYVSDRKPPLTRVGAVGMVVQDGCEVRLCDPCPRVSPCVPCVSRLPPVSYRYRTRSVRRVQLQSTLGVSTDNTLEKFGWSTVHRLHTDQF